MNVPLEKHCTMVWDSGQRTLSHWYRTLHSNAVIGADGFGFRPCPERGLVKIPQIGNVIGNNVEIGANSCVIVENLVLRF
jgi:hypothetical protein